MGLWVGRRISLPRLRPRYPDRLHDLAHNDCQNGTDDRVQGQNYERACAGGGGELNNTVCSVCIIMDYDYGVEYVLDVD
jgi:hypothetical protein